MKSVFGKRLKELRHKKYTQEELADVLNVHKGTVSNWENGHRFPDEQTLIRLSDILECSTDYLLGKTDIVSPVKDIFTGKELADIVPDEWKEVISKVEYLELYQKMKKEDIDPNELIKAYKMYLTIKENMKESN